MSLIVYVIKRILHENAALFFFFSFCVTHPGCCVMWGRTYDFFPPTFFISSLQKCFSKNNFHSALILIFDQSRRKLFSSYTSSSSRLNIDFFSLHLFTTSFIVFYGKKSSHRKLKNSKIRRKLFIRFHRFFYLIKHLYMPFMLLFPSTLTLKAAMMMRIAKKKNNWIWNSVHVQ